MKKIEIHDLSTEALEKILKDSPTFIQESLIPNETMFNPRLNQYVERGR